MAESSWVAVIMAGGHGTRFWPLSRKTLPKQYLKLIGNRTLIQQTFDRLKPLTRNVFVCTLEEQAGLVREQLPEVQTLILEPQPKNTAACLMLSVSQLTRLGYGPDTIMVTCPADHTIQNGDAFCQAIRKAAAFAQDSGALITFGIVPTSPHTGYGYIEASTEQPQPEIFKVSRFIEKPNQATAERLVQQSNCFWNSGIFVWRLNAISQAFDSLLPKAWKLIQAAKDEAALKNIYQNLESVPIDIAVLEKWNKVYVLPTNLAWNDLGSWDTLYKLLAKGKDQVVLSGDLKSISSDGCLIKVPEGKRVALVGIKNAVVVDTGDTLLIADRSCDQLVREVSKEFEK